MKLRSIAHEPAAGAVLLAAVMLVAAFSAPEAAAQLAPVAPAAANEEPAGDLVQTIAVPAPLELTEIRKAIVTSALGRKWSVTKADDSRVVVRLVDGGQEANLTLFYTASEIRVHSNSYRVKRSGERTGRIVPERWLRYLTRDIEVNLSSAAFLAK